ncbi:unnamed protein product [Paramecium sonneborni]|uniref:Uncharacterized protein n=1 Tax=Paramecium sonneborni TaxID=65129 RepID=A0A8S1MT40_9CILI|nr:unnamed protein product [Paramecium sonneborni]
MGYCCSKNQNNFKKKEVVELKKLQKEVNENEQNKSYAKEQEQKSSIKEHHVEINREPASQPESEIIVQPTQQVEDLKSILNDETQSVQDQKNFQEAFNSIRDRIKSFNRKKVSIEEQLSSLFIRDQDENESKDQLQNHDFKGPRMVNRNICDTRNKYDFSRVEQFTQYKGSITLVKLIQKKKSSICTYIGKIEQKYCCVKLIPMTKVVYINKWIESVKKAQSRENLEKEIFLDYLCQKYHYYKIELLNNEPDYCNCYIISNLEQYNAYTFSHHPSIKLIEKLSIAYYLIQIICVVLRKEDDQQDQQPVRFIRQIFKNTFTVKRNNILISRLEQEQKRYTIVLSDWQLLLPEFENIIPNKKLQNEDKLYEETENKFYEIISSQIYHSDRMRNIIYVENFTKRFLKLLFFRVNVDIQSDIELYGFINETKFEKICETKINIIERQEYQDYQILTKIIQNYHQMSNYQNDRNDQQIFGLTNKLLTKKSQLIFQEFQLNNSDNCPWIYWIYLMLKNLQIEKLRAAFMDLLQDPQKKVN